MSRETQITPVLDAGVSQQPPDQRSPAQLEAASNVVFDLGFGFHKRPGTVFDRAFTAAAGMDFQIKPWQADGEEYMVLYGRGLHPAGDPGIVRVFSIGGNECTVTIAAAAATYLALNDAAGMQWRFRRLEDYGLIINTTVASGLTTSSSYTVERVRPTYRDVIVFSTTVSNYVRSESDDASARAGYYQYTPGSSLTYAHINFQTIGATASNPWSIYNGYWDDNNYGNPVGFRIAFRREDRTGFTAATWTAATRTLTKTGAFTTYALQSRDHIYLDTGTNLTAGWYEIATRVSNDAITLKSSAGLSATDETDWTANVTAADYSETNVCRIGQQVEVNVDIKARVDDGTATSMHDIAALLTTALRNAGAFNACCAWVPQASGGAFQITGPYRGSGAMVYAPSAVVQTVATNGELTNDATDPFYNAVATLQIVAGSGSISTNNATDTPESRWTRVAAPNESNAKVDTTKMPVKVTRSSSTAFAVDPDTFDERTSGDTTSNPGRKLFINAKKIRDVAHFRDRRVYAGEGGYLAFSEAGDHNNFFLDNASNIVDSDPFDRTLPAVGAAAVEFLEPFREALVVFTTGSLILEVSANDTFTVGTASVSAGPRVKTQQVWPASTSAYLYFVATAGDFTRLREYFYDDIRVASDSGDISLQIPRLIDEPSRALAVSHEHGTAFILPSDDYTLYAYFFRYSGTSNVDGRKLQSAWGTFTFDSSVRIVDICILNDELWLLTENVGTVSVSTNGTTTVTITDTAHGYSTGDDTYIGRTTTSPTFDGAYDVTVVNANTYTITTSGAIASGTTTARRHTGNYILERLPLVKPTAASGWDYPVHLDRQLTLTGVHSLGTTTWTLPSTPTVTTGSAQFRGLGSTINKGVLGPAFGASSGVTIDTFGYTATTITKSGDYSAGSVAFGRYFDVSVEPTRPFQRNREGQAIASDQLKVEKFAVTYASSGDFTITVTPSHTASAPTVSHSIPSTYVPEEFGTLVLNTPFNASDPITITSSSAHPLTITSLRYDGEFSPTGIVNTR